MTAQRALRELQTMGLTYGVVGKGTFVHPEAPARVKILDGEQPHPVPSGDIIADPELNARMARYLLKRDAMVAKTVEMFDALKDKTKSAPIIAELSQMQAELEAESEPLHDELERYRARLTQTAGQTGDTDEPPAAEPPKRARRTPKK